MSAGILHFLDKEGILKSETFTSSGTFTVPSGITSVFVKGQGAGGSGAAGSAVGSSAAGGGAGHYGIEIITTVPNSNVTVTIGSGGSSVASPSNGNNGGVTSFGSTSFRPGKGGLILAQGIPATVVNGQGAGSGGNGGGRTSSTAFGLNIRGEDGQDGPHFSGGNGLPTNTGTTNPTFGGGGGSGLAAGGNANDVGAGSAGGIGAGGGAGSTASGAGGRGEITVYWIDPT